MRTPAAAIFDNDGLFLDTEGAWTRAEVVLFGRRGTQFTATHKHDLIGSSHLVAGAKLERMLGRPGEGGPLMAELHALVMEEARRDVAPMPGAVELVAALRAAGMPVGLASNSPRAFVERTLATSDTRALFDTIVAGDDVTAPKPAPDVYLAACAALGLEPARCIALEDSPVGVAAARAAGLRVIGVPYLADIALDADLVAPSLADPAVYAFLGLAEAA